MGVSSPVGHLAHLWKAHIRHVWKRLEVSTTENMTNYIETFLFYAEVIHVQLTVVCVIMALLAYQLDLFFITTPICGHTLYISIFNYTRRMN